MKEWNVKLSYRVEGFAGVKTCRMLRRGRLRSLAILSGQGDVEQVYFGYKVLFLTSEATEIPNGDPRVVGDLSPAWQQG